jgi:hypothetical protein
MPRGGGDLEICFVVGFTASEMLNPTLWRLIGLSIYVFIKEECSTDQLIFSLKRLPNYVGLKVGLHSLDPQWKVTSVRVGYNEEFVGHIGGSPK